MRLQREVRELETRKFSFEAFDSMTSKFSGDDAYDVKKWFDDMERAFLMFTCRESDKLIAANRAVTGTAKTFLRSKRVLTYDDFKAIMLKEFVWY